MRDTKQPVQIIGWDSAVQEGNNGLVAAEYWDGRIRITDQWDHKVPLDEILQLWIGRSTQTLLAIDCPLGWPATFGTHLAGHQAGQPLAAHPLRFFKRLTDINIQERFGKIPLEVSADRIARTAFFTLGRLGKMGGNAGHQPGMLWDPEEEFSLGMIEVYPAAILLASGLKTSGYKNKMNDTVRSSLLREMTACYNVQIPADMNLISVEHDFDAFLCCLAGSDFLSGKCEGPPSVDEEIIKEGWTWIKTPVKS